MLAYMSASERPGLFTFHARRCEEAPARTALKDFWKSDEQKDPLSGPSICAASQLIPL